MTDNVPPHTGVIDKGGLTNDPRPTMNGRGDAGSVIHVLVDGREVGTAVVKPNGTWSFSLPRALSDGEYRLTVRASNDAGRSVPSTSYGILVDTTPPSQPKIEAVSEGTSPMLSGRAEAYSTVAVYDGATLLGTTTTKMDGTWTFQLPSGMSNGTHALTVSAMDPAGNTSVRSEGFDVTVGPVAPPVPTTKAVLDEMGRDSGSFNFDRLTNDGTAGRLLSGHLTAALKAGEKVQVSTDGGRTWVDAIVKSDGTWLLTDLKGHASNWTIQTRVVNGDNVAGPLTTYDVELDTTAPGPLKSAIRSGNAIEVSFDGSGLTAGDMINVMIGDHRISYRLTAADISAGRVKVGIPENIAATIDEHTSYGAALVDGSGNISDYLVTKFVETNFGGNGNSGISYKVTDFNNEKLREIVGGTPVNFGVFTAVLAKPTIVNGQKVDQGIRVKGGSGSDAHEVGLVFSFQETPKFHLNNGAHARAVSFDLDNRSTVLLMVRFYDDAGKLIFLQHLYGPDLNNLYAGGVHSYQIVLPDGLQFSSFTIGWYAGGEGAMPGTTATAWIDNIGFAGGSFDGLAPTAQVDFNNEKLREIVGGTPVNFGVFTAVLVKPTIVNGQKVDQGIRVKGGSGPDANEVGLVFSFQEAPKFHLNNGAHAGAVNFDLDNRSTSVLMVRFYDDAGKQIHQQYLYGSDLNHLNGSGIHSYQIVLPDALQFSSFSIGWYGRSDGSMPGTTATAWIDNIGFSGGSFVQSGWEAITALVPPADVQHVLDTSDAAYFGSINGTEFQLDQVSYFSNGGSGIHGGSGVDILKIMTAGQVLDLSTLLNVNGHDKLSSIEIIDLTGTGNNMLKMSMKDVLELGHADVFRADGNVQMMVRGDAGDRIELSGMRGLDGGQWTQRGMVAVDGVAYTLYENTALHVELLVQMAVTTQLV
ncbi:Ig-like domain-containing protein [Burkholderia pyrrocinia]|uniref:Ig-like domain-containing protein n=1 Tax=Burkholderia pyrrocinia TaxID=60550 RepID=UPI00215B2F92|nr:Ig-like domain-containing protein [Burkholderia pyrrocinia]UVE63999.1 Ig-like domain-containing protein [Burkholderia pyrrocinia]